MHADKVLLVDEKKHTFFVNHIKKKYGARTVVEDVSLEMKSGEVVGLLGPNGAGKTTSFYMMVGIIPCDHGEIYIDGKLVSNLSIHHRSRLGLSYLPQEPSIFRKLTVEENVLAVLELQIKRDGSFFSKKEYIRFLKEKAFDLLLELQITHIKDSLGVSLSGGERRRVEIARALACNPVFILLDEPFAGVDPIAVIEIQKIVNFLKSRNIGVLITDHNVRETLGICDHAYIINRGKVLASGCPGEIIHDSHVRKVYLGENFRM